MTRKSKMQLTQVLSVLALTGFALAGPVKPAACKTEYTVTTSYSPVTTVYKTIEAIPKELDCGSCSLVVKTKTIGKSCKPTKTVTVEKTLTNIPICAVFPPTPTACVTKYTVTTSLTGTTTVYKSLAAVPLELDCKGCDLKVVTKTVGTAKPTKTVTKHYTLLHPPVCTVFPTQKL